MFEGLLQPSEALFIERNHMVQQLLSAASDPTFGHSILPGRLAANELRFPTHETQRS